MLEVIGIILILIGVILLIKGMREKMGMETIEFYQKEYPFGEPSKKIEGGGVILIGPIPIVFGNSKYAVFALILAIILLTTLIMFYSI